MTSPQVAPIPNTHFGGVCSADLAALIKKKKKTAKESDQLRAFLRLFICVYTYRYISRYMYVGRCKMPCALDSGDASHPAHRSSHGCGIKSMPIHKWTRRRVPVMLDVAVGISLAISLFHNYIANRMNKNNGHSRTLKRLPLSTFPGKKG